MEGVNFIDTEGADALKKIAKAGEASRIMGKCTSLIVGLVVIVGGLLVVSRRVTDMWVYHTLLVQVLAIVILLTGVRTPLHGLTVSTPSQSGFLLRESWKFSVRLWTYDDNPGVI